jgi:RNA polymerase sigma-70 factor (ECF subfamily)
VRFERLALPLAPSLRAAARRWFRDGAAADDAVQETFLRAYRTFASFRSGTNARAWLFTILYSVCANEHARVRVRRHEEITEDSREFAARDDGFLEGLRFPRERAELARELAALPDAYRDAIAAVDLDGLSYEEAAESLACPVGTLRSRLSRGRRALAQKLAHLAPRLRSS